MLLCPWGFPGKNTGVCCHFLLQGIFLTQGSSPYPLHCRQNLYCWATKEACIIDNFFILKFSLWLCRRMSLCIWDAYYIVWDSRALYRKIILRWFGYNKSLLYLQIFYKFDILSKIMCFEDSAQFSPVAQLCLTLCDPMGCSLLGSSVHGIFQAIVLEWIAISFSRGSSWPRDRTWVSRIVDRRLTFWATREVQAYTLSSNYLAL